MTSGVWGVSVHHALGGRPLLLVVLGHRNGPEAQANATTAGYRLNRVQGGFSGTLALDARWYAFFMRVNEIAVVATYPAHAEPSDAMRAACAARAALVDACGGKVSDVTLSALARCGAEMQLTVRRAVTGCGRIAGIGTPKFDISTVHLGPDAPPDDSTSSAVRAANDVVSTALTTEVAGAAATAAARADAVVDALPRALKNVSAWSRSAARAAVSGAAADATAAYSATSRYVAAGAGDDGEGSLLARGRTRARLALFPRDVMAALESRSPPPPLPSALSATSGRRRARVAGDSDGDADAASDDEVNAVDALWTGVGSGLGSDEIFSLPASTALVPPPPLATPILVRVAAAVTETVTVVGSSAAAPATTTGAVALRYMYAGPLDPAIEASGHGALPLSVEVSAPPGAALASVTVALPPSPGAGAQSEKPIELVTGAPATRLTVQLTLPARAPCVTAYVAGELGALAYRLVSPMGAPPVLRVVATARATFTPGAGGAPPTHAHTDVLVRTTLDAGITSAASQVQFLVTLPTLDAPAAYSDAPIFKPAAQWALARATALWALSDATEDGGSADVPRVKTHFLPGVTAEFRARVPVTGAAPMPPTAQSAVPFSLPVQARFGLSGQVHQITVAAAAGVAVAAANTVLDAAAGVHLRVKVDAVLVKASSSVRALFKADAAGK